MNSLEIRANQPSRNKIIFFCLWDHKQVLVPRKVFDSKGNVKEEFKNKTLRNEVYISFNGDFYCSQEHWVEYSEMRC